MSGAGNKEPFPRIVRWALLGPFVLFAAAFVFALLGKDSQPNRILNAMLVFSTLAAAMVEVLAVPVALFLLVRDGRYVSWGNVGLTLAAAIPVVLVAFVVFVFNFGHFHI